MQSRIQDYRLVLLADPVVPIHHTIPTDSVPTDVIPTVHAQSGRR